MHGDVFTAAPLRTDCDYSICCRSYYGRLSLPASLHLLVFMDHALIFLHIEASTGPSICYMIKQMIK